MSTQPFWCVFFKKNKTSIVHLLVGRCLNTGDPVSIGSNPGINSGFLLVAALAGAGGHHRFHEAIANERTARITLEGDKTAIKTLVVEGRWDLQNHPKRNLTQPYPTMHKKSTSAFKESPHARLLSLTILLPVKHA